MAVVERSRRYAGGCPISRAGSVNLNARASGCQLVSVGLTESPAQSCMTVCHVDFL